MDYKKHKFLFAILVLMLIASIAYSGVLSLEKVNNANKEPLSNTQNSSSITKKSKLEKSTQQLPTQQIQFADWLTYESENGFSFKYPKGYGVTETPTDDSILVFIVQTDENGDFMESVTPSFQITVSDYGVSFSLWEGMEWEGYPDIIKTFERDI